MKFLSKSKKILQRLLRRWIFPISHSYCTFSGGGSGYISSLCRTASKSYGSLVLSVTFSSILSFTWTTPSKSTSLTSSIHLNHWTNKLGLNHIYLLTCIAIPSVGNTSSIIMGRYLLHGVIKGIIIILPITKSLNLRPNHLTLSKGKREEEEQETSLIENNEKNIELFLWDKTSFLGFYS